MSRVFVSYVRQDAPIAEALAARLAADDHRVFVDTQRLQGGDPFVSEILREIKRADHVVVVVSKAAEASRWLHFEVGLATAYAQDKRVNCVIPLLLSDVDPTSLPAFLTGRHHVVCSGTELTPAAGDALAAAVQRFELVFYRTKSERMRLCATVEGLSLYLDDRKDETTELRWTISPADCLDILESGDWRVDPYDDSGEGLLDIGPRTEWLYSKKLFADGEAELAAHVDKLLRLASTRG